MSRVYLDHNATAPLRAEAKAAMADAMELVGNPSSVHAEGRAAKALLERARADLAEVLGAATADIVFTSGATEAAMLGLHGRSLQAGGVEHDCVLAWTNAVSPVDPEGHVRLENPAGSALQRANSETGILQDLPDGLAFCDVVQAFGKIPFGFDWSGVGMAIVSAHKIGGPKGVGALVLRQGTELAAQIKGGGQEMGRRSGTENLIGIAGFAAAAKAAQRDLDAGKWDAVRDLRDAFEDRIRDRVPGSSIIGKDVARLPNTSAIVTPGWKGETQVMQMDLAGFAISAGSACSSGKVAQSSVLRAMGLDPVSAGSAIRVSIGTETKAEALFAFVDSWARAHEKFAARAA